MPPLSILDLDDPQIGIELTLLADRGVNLALITLGQFDPLAFPAHQIIRTLKRNRLSVQSVQLHQNRAGRIIPMGDHKCRDVLKPEPCQIGLHPKFSGQTSHGAIPPTQGRARPGTTAGSDRRHKKPTPAPAATDPDATLRFKTLVAVLKVQPHFRIALGLVQPVGPHFDLQKQMNLAIQKLFQLCPGRLAN